MLDIKQTDRGKTVYPISPFGERGYNNIKKGTGQKPLDKKPPIMK
jgi:hypothetical protein